MDRLYTIKEIAEKLGVPESNLRYYRDKIGDFLPSVGRGRKRRYQQEATDILARAIELVQDGMPLDRVYATLAGEKPIVYPQKETQMTPVTSPNVILEKIKEEFGFLDRYIELERRNASLESLLNNANNEISILQEKKQRFEKEFQEKNKNLIQLQVARDTFSRALSEKEGELKRIKEELAKLHGQISEKERIIEYQRKQLVEDRHRKATIYDEIHSVRSLMERMLLNTKTTNQQNGSNM